MACLHMVARGSLLYPALDYVTPLLKSFSGPISFRMECPILPAANTAPLGCKVTPHLSAPTLAPSALSLPWGLGAHHALCRSTLTTVGVFRCWLPRPLGPAVPTCPSHCLSTDMLGVACHCLHPGSQPSTQEGTAKGMSGGSRQPDALSGNPRGLAG